MRIFISQSDEDQEIVERLSKGLQEAGHQVWMPEREILPGDNWAEAEVPWSLRRLSWLRVEAGTEAETARRIAHALSPAYAGVPEGS